jgi:hypothetical protein
METTISIILVSLILLIFVLPLLLFVRKSTDLSLQGNLLTLKYPLKDREIDLEKSLASWRVQEAYFLRLGKMYALNLELDDGKWVTISSRFQPQNYNMLFKHLNKNFPERRKPDNK